MEDPYGGRVFVTTTIKAKAVSKLLDYWTMKTDLMKKRADPTLFASKEIQQKTRKYVMENSSLQDHSFWNSLGSSIQESAMKCFSMLEVNEEKKEMISNSKFKSIVYVCLSGNAAVRDLKNDSTVRYGPGDVFGGVELFNAVVNDSSSFLNDDDSSGVEDMVIEFDGGTYMRLELKDLYNTALRPDTAEEERLKEEAEKGEAEKISGITWAELTEKDKFYIQVYQKTKKRMNKTFFSFLDCYRMIPKNESNPACKYYMEANINREIYLDPTDQTWVFVLIDGSVLVEATIAGEGIAGGRARKSHTITCYHKDNTPMHVKLRSMPLMRLSSGSVLCLYPECFHVEAEPATAMNHHHHHHLGGGGARTIADEDTGSLSTSNDLDLDRHHSGGHHHADSSVQYTRGMEHSASEGQLPRRGRRGSAAAASTAAGTGSTRGILRSGARKHQTTAGASCKSSKGFLANFPHNRLSKTATPTTAAGASAGGTGINSSLASSSAVGGGRGGVGARRPSDSSVETASTAQTGKTFASLPSVQLHKVVKQSDRFVPSPHPVHVHGQRYHIKLTFESFSSFLVIPYTNFEKILDDNKMVLPKIAKEMKWQLSSASDVIKDRLERIMPWVKGNKNYDTKERLRKKVDDLGFIPADVGPKEDDLANTIGSFTSTQEVRMGSLLFEPPTPAMPKEVEANSSGRLWSDMVAFDSDINMDMQQQTGSARAAGNEMSAPLFSPPTPKSPTTASAMSSSNASPSGKLSKGTSMKKINPHDETLTNMLQELRSLSGKNLTSSPKAGGLNKSKSGRGATSFLTQQEDGSLVVSAPGGTVGTRTGANSAGGGGSVSLVSHSTAGGGSRKLSMEDSIGFEMEEEEEDGNMSSGSDISASTFRVLDRRAGNDSYLELTASASSPKNNKNTTSNHQNQQQHQEEEEEEVQKRPAEEPVQGHVQFQEPGQILQPTNSRETNASSVAAAASADALATNIQFVPEGAEHPTLASSSPPQQQNRAGKTVNLMVEMVPPSPASNIDDSTAGSIHDVDLQSIVST